MDIRDNSAKLLNAHHHYNLSRSVFLKRSRHHYGHQYSRRNSGNHGTSSHGKAPALHDDRLSFKLASQCNTVPGSNPINREKSFSGPERIRLSSLVTDATSPDAVKMVCGICKKLLRRKPFFLGMGNTLASGEYAVVAVLVCCHVYHADCLEQKTSLEDICDPPCPLCLGLLSQVESPGEQE